MPRHPAPALPATRHRILDAAEAAFARQGFAATSIKTIGQASRLNPALIYYYFGDKAGLYHAVLRRRFEALGATLLPVLRAASVPPEEAIGRVIRAYAGFLLEHPDLPRLMLREIIDHDARHALSELQASAGGLFRHLVALVARGQAEGVFRRDLDPVNVVVSMIGQVVYAFLAQPLIRAVLLAGRGRQRQQFLHQFADHAATFALAALRPEPSKASTTRTTRAPRHPARRGHA